jgi:hypothetical protein
MIYFRYIMYGFIGNLLKMLEVNYLLLFFPYAIV